MAKKKKRYDFKTDDNVRSLLSGRKIKNTDPTTFLPSNLLKLLDVEDYESSLQGFLAAISILLYLPVDDEIELTFGKLKKIDENLIYLDVDLDLDELDNFVKSKEIIKIPW